DHRSPPNGWATECGRGGLGRHGNHTVLERLLPEILELKDLFLLHKNVALPEGAQIGIVVRLLVPEPLEQALLSGTSSKERGDQRLGEAEMGIHGFGIAPRLKEMVIRTNGVRVRACLIAAIGEGYGQRNFFQPGKKSLRTMVVKSGIYAQHEQRVHLPAGHL